MKRYTREQLVFYLKKLSGELKRTPKITDMNKNKKYPSSATYFSRFSSWNNALKEAGLKLNVRNTYEKKELTDSLKLLAKELARPPKPKDLKGKDWAASYTTYRKHFGSWKEALRQAGIKTIISPSLKHFAKKK
jgi:hypothetical protein